MNKTLENNNGIFPVKVISSYATKITGKFRKYVKIYVKFAYPLEIMKQKNQKAYGEVFLEVPAFDFQAGYFFPGKIILLKFVEDSEKSVVVYLGPEGDWETMYNLKGTNPDKKVSAKEMGYTFASFSEIYTTTGVFEDESRHWIEVKVDNLPYVTAVRGKEMINGQYVYYIKPGLGVTDELRVSYGTSLLRDYCRSKGYMLVENQSGYTPD